MKKRGEIPDLPDNGFREELPPGFWENAELVNHNQPRPTSVHLKLDPEVFNYFKSQGKGHLTRMQNVLKAYVRAHQQRGG